MLEQYGELSRTASQAIGYAEALSVIDGSAAMAEAIDRTSTRTRQLAKKQSTWFRNQADVDLIDARQTVEETADLVHASWKTNGPCPILPEDRQKR